MVLRESFTLVAIGLAIGVPCAIAVGGAARGLLFGLAPADPMILAGAAAVLAVAALLATFWPARRAAKVDPMTALRTE
jgi:ABC-type antimicrobial peptide transport system permease subunit